MAEVLAYLEKIAAVFGCIGGIITGSVLLIKPLREKLLGFKSLKSGMECVLRYNMLNVYYTNRESKTIHQYDMENLCAEYQAYKALGGNGFMDKLYDKITHWETVE